MHNHNVKYFNGGTDTDLTFDTLYGCACPSLKISSIFSLLKYTIVTQIDKKNTETTNNSGTSTKNTTENIVIGIHKLDKRIMSSIQL